MNDTITADRTVTIMRLLDAPRELVFRLWTEPKHLAQWWGPHGFTNPVCEVDVRVGGWMHIDMQGPDGIVYPMTGTFREIMPPRRLVFEAVAEDHAGVALLRSLTVVTFADEGGRTRLTVHADAIGLAPAAPQMLAGMEAGWTQSLEKLEKLVRQAVG
jgi:uncharacterized protein YndB with AHSA1/START domain